MPSSTAKSSSQSPLIGVASEANSSAFPIRLHEFQAPLPEFVRDYRLGVTLGHHPLGVVPGRPPGIDVLGDFELRTGRVPGVAARSRAGVGVAEAPQPVAA